jgi:hypothetical protein
LGEREYSTVEERGVAKGVVAATATVKQEHVTK